MRISYRYGLAIVGLLLVCMVFILAFSRHGSNPRVPMISETDELVVLVLNSPTTLYINSNGNYAGIEYELVRGFAENNDYKVRFIIVQNYQEMQQKLLNKEAHLAVGMVQSKDRSHLMFGPSYHTVNLSFIYQNQIGKKKAFEVLASGEPLAIPKQYIPFIAGWKKQFTSPFIIKEVIQEDNEALISAVAEGSLPFAVVDSLSIDVASNYYPNVGIYAIPTTQLQLAWALRTDDPELNKKVQQYFATIKKDQSLRYLQTLYYGHINRLRPPDIQAFLLRRKTVLPKYKAFFWAAEKATGIDWRLLAALAYQESHWNEQATSAYGVRGLMMLTNDTAQRLGVTNRLDPFQSIMGGAQYVKTLEGLFPEEMHIMDRHWLALAAYNVGIGHLNDARKIAASQKKNPNAWADVKTTLPLLREQTYFSQTKHGYARGWEPVIFVESLRTYYDILVRFESPLHSTSPFFNEKIEIINPTNRILAINGVLQDLSVSG